MSPTTIRDWGWSIPPMWFDNSRFVSAGYRDLAESAAPFAHFLALRYRSCETAAVVALPLCDSMNVD